MPPSPIYFNENMLHRGCFEEVNNEMYRSYGSNVSDNMKKICILILVNVEPTVLNPKNGLPAPYHNKNMLP